MKSCSRKAWSSRRLDIGIGSGPRNGDSDTSETGGWLERYLLRESPTVGVTGMADVDEAKSSEREAASLYDRREEK